MPIPDPIKNTVRLANNCGIPEKVKRHAISLMQDIIDNGISASKNPTGLVAAVLYLSFKYHDENITLRKKILQRQQV